MPKPLLYNLGIKHFDVSGLGGTNWGKVEAIRASLKGMTHATLRVNGFGDYWGIPTALSILTTRTAAPRATIIASGGIRNGLDIARSIALGADLAAMALPLLRILLRKGRQALKTFLQQLIYQIRVATYLSGANNIRGLQCVSSILLSGGLGTLFEQQLRLNQPNLDITNYLAGMRCISRLEVSKGWRL